MFCEYTSGTTASPLGIWSSRKTQQNWFALFEARWRQWYGVSRVDRWAILGGQLVTPVSQKRAPFWVWNPALRQLYMSSYHLAPQFVPYYLDALEEYGIRYLWGYSSSLHALAQEALRLHRKIKMTVAIANAEPLFEHQKAVIADAFCCAVRETYGMCEMVAAAGECEAGRLHLWPEVGVVEVESRSGGVSQSGAGDLVCTSLLNADMPLIRYRVGDHGELPSESATCSCGRSLPMISAIEGRTDDLLYTADGRVVGRLDPVFKGTVPVRAAQIIQETLTQIRLRYVAEPEFGAHSARSLVEGIRARMGDVNVILEEVSEIPRSANGKFRAVICNLKK